MLPVCPSCAELSDPDSVECWSCGTRLVPAPRRPVRGEAELGLALERHGFHQTSTIAPPPPSCLSQVEEGGATL